MNYFKKLFSREFGRKTAMMLTCSMLAAIVLPYGSLTVNAEETTAVTESGNEIAPYNTVLGVNGSSEEPESTEEPGSSEEPIIYTGGICVEQDGKLFGKTEIYLKVVNGELQETTGEDYNFHYMAATSGGNAKIELNNFIYESPETDGEDNEVYNAIGFFATDEGVGVPLDLTLTGDNNVAAQQGSALDVCGSLYIFGDGTLTARTVDKTPTPDDENPNVFYYVPAVAVGGKEFVCSASITCDAAGTKIANTEDNPFAALDLVVSDPNAFVNTVIYGNGKVTGKAVLGDVCADGLVPYTTQHADKSGYTYVGKAYYFMDQSLIQEEYRDSVWSYPNNIVENLAENEWRVIGKYDESGHPIPSDKYYQGYYYLPNGGPITNDFHYPVKYLLYDDDEEVKDENRQATDIVCIADGKSHTFNTDLYGLSLINGDVTVNGNVTLDLTCFEQYGRAGEDEERNTIFLRDNDGNIIFTSASSVGAKVTVNGNVGCLSLNESYQGNADVTGNINYIARYYDKHAIDSEPIPETFYGSMVSAGQVINAGEFVAKVQELQGYQGYGVFEGTCYPKTLTQHNEETFNGTSAPIGDEALLIQVGADGIGEKTYPCVKQSDEAEMQKIMQALTDRTSKVTAMDITLIQDDTKTVEPEKEVSLYVDNLASYNKPALFHIKQDGTIEKLYAFEGSNFSGTIECKTGSFSTYFITEDQKLAGSQEPEESTKPSVTPQPTTTPAPDNSSGSGSSDSTPEQKTVDWQQVTKDVNLSASTQGNLNYSVQGENLIPVNVLQQLAGTKKTLAFHSGNGIALSISGQNVNKRALNGGKPMNLTVAEGKLSAEVRKTKEAGSAKNIQVSIYDSGAFAVPVNLHVNAGAENAGKYANLYRYNAKSGKLEYCGSYRVNTAGQAMFGLKRGGEYLITVTNTMPRETDLFTEGEYLVKRGDTLVKIAARYKLSLLELLRRNPQISNSNMIYPGQRIRLN